MSAINWLIDANSDPAIRWQALRDLTDAPEHVIAAERARVEAEGWGARLLALQGADGQWAGGTYFPALDTDPHGQPWTATAFSLQLLRDFGVDPDTDRLVRAIALVRESSRWEHARQRFFDGEVEPCINGLAVAIGGYFRQDVDGIVARLVAEAMADGGWNCEAENGSVRSSFNSTIVVLEGLWEYERHNGAVPDVAATRIRAENYLLERHLMRRLSTGEVPDDRWRQFSYPPRWYYDVLRGLDYFRAVGEEPDARLAEAVSLLESKCDSNGRWPLENTHPGAVHFALEPGDGQPSRWNTLRALRVLRWYRGEAPVGYESTSFDANRPIASAPNTTM